MSLELFVIVFIFSVIVGKYYDAIRYVINGIEHLAIVQFRKNDQKLKVWKNKKIEKKKTSKKNLSIHLPK